MQLVPGDTFEVIWRDGQTETRGGVFVVADAPGRPSAWPVSRDDVALTADEVTAPCEAVADKLPDAVTVMCMTVTAATALVELARGGGSAEDDAP